MQKYYLDNNDTIDYKGHILRRIIYTEEFKEILREYEVDDSLSKFTPYIESYDNLSQDGYCIVYGNSRIYNNARIYGNAHINSSVIYENAKVYDSAYISYSTLRGNVRVYNMAKVLDSSTIMDNVRIYGMSFVLSSVVKNNTRIFGCTEISSSNIVGNTWIYKKAMHRSLNTKGQFELEGFDIEGCCGCKYYEQCHFKKFNIEDFLNHDDYDYYERRSI